MNESVEDLKRENADLIEENDALRQWQAAAIKLANEREAHILRLQQALATAGRTEGGLSPC